MILGDQHTEKVSYRKTSDSASAATNHSPAEVEEKCQENKKISHNEHIKENNTQSSSLQNEFTNSNMISKEHNFPNNTLNKTEDFNSSRESIDVETTHTEDIKPFSNIHTTTAAATEVKCFRETPKELNSAAKKEDGNPSQVDWSAYHLGDMALDVWLQTVRKHIVLALIRHPK